MATPRVTIDQLPEQVAPEDTNLLIVQDAGVTKKLSVSTLKTITSDALTAHINDPTGAHPASAISATPSAAGINGPDVQAQLGQLATLADAGVTQTEGDARYLQLAGGTVSGTLTTTSALAANGGLTSAGPTIVPTPTLGTEATTKAYVDAVDVLKADKTYVDAADALKADKTYVDAQDATKVDKTYVDAADSLKADKVYVDAADALKADRTYVDAQDATKADKTYVDAADALKADKTYVDAADALKADKTYVDSKDATKADITYVNSADALKADKTYVDAQLAGKLTPAQGDTAYVNITGDTLTGPLLLAADPSAALGAATKQYVDGASNWAYVGDTAPPGAYLTATVGTATTPDPGPLPTDCVFVFKVRGPTTSSRSIVSQWEAAPQLSWDLRRATTNQLLVYLSTDGSDFPSVATTGSIPTGSDEYWAVALTLNNGSNQRRASCWSSVDGASWTKFHDGGLVASQTVFDSNAVIRVGGLSGTRWDGRIYSVELRSGLDPAAGSVLWRFDANDYPGTGTSYVDPRGRTWTLTSASAITKPRPAKTGDIYIDTGSDITYSYNGTTWTSQGLLGDAAVAATPLHATRPHLYLPATTGNFITAPDPPQLAGATQLDIRWIEKAPLNGVAGYGPSGVIATQGSSSAAFSFVMLAQAGGAGAVFYTHNNTGVLVVRNVRPTAGVAAARMTWRSSDGRVQGFTKQTADVAAMLDNTGWTQVGADGVLGATPLPDSAMPLTWGTYSTGASPTVHSTLAASIATTIDGTPFACWRADPQARQYTDDYGTRWTINGTAWEWRDANALQIGGPEASDVITGTGFPEGVVTAPVGQRYIDTAATNGAIEWIKASGTGNTGWRVSDGDTGWRAIAAGDSADVNWSAANLKLRRVGSMVTIYNFAVCTVAGQSTSAAWVHLYTPPVGFRAAGSGVGSTMTGHALLSGANWPHLVGLSNQQTATVSTLAMGGLTGRPATYAVNDRVYATFNYPTQDAWPATLPGTAN